ncbi:MAG: AMP-binding protein [Candidatus Margulisbacteria bacterium]|nr:AMP-binding protein [Candidatus Margulisiibacteriota bacterium]
MEQLATLKEVLESTVGRHADSIAFQMRGESGFRKFSFKDVADIVNSLSIRLAQAGIKKGDRVALFSENRPEWPLAYLAVTTMGAVVVPIDAVLHKNEVKVLMDDCEAAAIIVSRDCSQNVAGKSIKHVIPVESMSDRVADEQDLPDVASDDLAAIVYTSGTTGVPKGVMLTHGNIASNVEAVAGLFDIGPGDNFLSVLPLHHTFETTAGFLGPFFLGATITYAESLKSYSLIQNMQETGTTIMCGVPLLYQLFYDGIIREVESKGVAARTLFQTLMTLAKNIPSQSIRRKMFGMLHKKFGGKLRFWVSGGAAIKPETIKGFEIFGIPIMQGYGLSESSPILTCCNLENNRVGSVGRPIPRVEIQIEDGEIVARGPNIMKGYYKRKDLTEEVLKNGWLRTGDMGSFDGDGFLYITGRCKDVIVTASGVNVYPEEIEKYLSKVPEIKECCVLGVSVKVGIRAGSEEVMAVVVPDYEYFEKKHKKIGQQEVEEIIRERISDINDQIADYKRVAAIKFRSIELPKTRLKKIKKFEVRKEMGL